MRAISLSHRIFIMSTRRVTRSASRPSLGSATVTTTTTTTNGSAASPARAASKPRASAKKKTVPAAHRLNRSQKALTSDSSEDKEQPGLVADTAPPPSKPPPRKRQKKSSTSTPVAAAAPSASAPSPPREGPQHHDEPELDALAEQHVLEDEEHEPHRLSARPADPHGTNATLQTPRGSRIVAYSAETLDGAAAVTAAAETGAATATKTKKKSKKSTEAAPPAEETKVDLAAPTPTTDTNRLLSDGIAHLLSVDPRLKPVIDAHHCHVFSPEGLAEPVDPFRALVSGILAQQVSGNAASAIKKRFVALFFPPPQPADGDGQGTEQSIQEDPDKSPFPTPEQVVEADMASLRSAGLSQRKAEYVVGLAEKFASGELSAAMLAGASYEEVLERLIAVRGLGRWSVEMFACWGLKRMDVFSTGDLGVQRGMAAFAGRDVARLKNKGGKWKYMAEQEMVDMADKFRPYRTLFMWYMWRVEDVNIDAMQNA